SSEATQGFATAGWNAAPVAGAVIERLGPMFGVRPVRPSEQVEAAAESVLDRDPPARAWDASLR
ncbi:MAG: hypothetical protein AAGL49_14320, partial [Pseudomonadota bacterium]